jgi:hypothetical protein
LPYFSKKYKKYITYTSLNVKKYINTNMSTNELIHNEVCGPKIASEAGASEAGASEADK